MTQEIPQDVFHGVVVFKAAEIPTVVARRSGLPMTQEAMSEFYDSTYSALFPALTAAGVTPTGPAFGLHTRMPSETVDIEAGIPVDGHPGDLPQGLLSSVLPAGTVAVTSYLGPYDGLGQAWGAFMEAVAAAGHTVALPLWESYVTMPSPDADPTTLRTDLFVLVKDS
ncbi:GyrI-like domain-containing protein [Kocuria sp. ZOR0020]|uniref:GyrI-like domain-containing protein n=1 Tax=Kocuria sp. ZOR0020 TaxID=1339234 RepID=UPI0006918CAB|nr:GyrI-like domain-containing protein [Kocuria sp. ZOR0020]